MAWKTSYDAGMSAIDCRDFIAQIHGFIQRIERRGGLWDDFALIDALISLHNHQAKWAIEQLELNRAAQTAVGITDGQ